MPSIVACAGRLCDGRSNVSTTTTGSIGIAAMLRGGEVAEGLSLMAAEFYAACRSAQDVMRRGLAFPIQRKHKSAVAGIYCAAPSRTIPDGVRHPLGDGHLHARERWAAASRLTSDARVPPGADRV